MVSSCQKTKVYVAPKDNSKTPPPSISPDPATYIPPTMASIKSQKSSKLYFSPSLSSTSSNFGDTYTPICSDSASNTYSVFIDEAFRLKIIKIKNEEIISQAILKEGIKNDIYHIRPSVTIDKRGYIHVAGGMHNVSWIYFKSLKPFDVASGFEPLNPPGDLITYPQFFKDRKDELYITFRHKVKASPNQWSSGSNGAGILKYKTETKTFEILGGTGHNLEKTMVWSETGGAGSAANYQKATMKLAFDERNRMHLVCPLINTYTTGTSEVNSHIIYAYSEDEGLTWNKIDGQKIGSLPLTVKNASIAVYSPAANISASVSLGTYKNQPIIAWSQGTSKFLLKYNGLSWENILPEPNASSEIYTRENGEICLFRPFNSVYISKNGGLSFDKLLFQPSLIPQYAAFNVDLYFRKGKIQFQYQSNAGNQITVATLDLL
jgi:hypothetical protein